jgi:hypothetical protein
MAEGEAQGGAGDDGDLARGSEVEVEAVGAEEDERLDPRDALAGLRLAQVPLHEAAQHLGLVIGEAQRVLHVAGHALGRGPAPVDLVAGDPSGVAFDLDEVDRREADHEEVDLVEAAGAGVEEVDEGPRVEGVLVGHYGEGEVDRLPLPRVGAVANAQETAGAAHAAGAFALSHAWLRSKSGAPGCRPMTCSAGRGWWR